MNFSQLKLITVGVALSAATLACGPAFLARVQPTATPTKTPKPSPTATLDPALITPSPTPTLPPTDTPVPPTTTATPLPTPTNAPTEAPTATPAPPTNTPKAAPAAAPAEPTAATTAAAVAEPTATPAPAVAYKITHFKVLGDGENNGGVFNKGGMHMIFLTVLDAAGNGVDGAVVKDANGSKLEAVTGNKGPGKTEIDMAYEPYKLYVASDPAGPTTSETSHQMNTLYPEVQDVVGKLGTLENETSVCPTLEVRCTPPFYNVHFSYEITFQKAN